jgi:serine/threonine protein kinase/Tol biopolymer transport system component
VVLAEDSMLGPYRIVGILGEGGMGAVYRAHDTRLGREVAIKVLTAVTLSDHEKLQRFEQEARTTGMLNHPNLLTVYDVGNHDGTPYLVTELLEGETLRDRLNRGAINPRKAVDIASQIANGLAAAHEKGIVHRDLKPENIFGTRDGRIKILDFGIAKLTRAGGEGPTFQPAATEPGMVMGTVGYMSPEQVRGEPVDQRSDIFAFGAIVYEMLSGSRAFKRNSSIETLSAILKEDPPELIDISPNIPPSLDRLVRRCMEKDRDLRFQTARDLAFNLETMSTTAQAPPPTPRPPAQPSETATMRMSSANTALRTAALPRAARMPTISKPLPKRRVSPALLALLYIVSVIGAALGGIYVYTHMLTHAVAEPVFHRMTFRRGEVRAARFSPDGDTIVYSAAWDGRPAEIFVGNRQSPEARPLGVQDAEVMGVSKSAELAILLHRDRITNLGTLARVPLAGGVPREVADGVAHADWSPDGQQLAVIRLAGDKYRLEYPIGTSRYETLHYIRDARVSPDGTRVAFIEPHGGEFDIAVVKIGSAPVTIARGWNRGASGLAWRPDGQEIWFTGTATSAPPALYAVTLDGDTRLVERLTGSMKLWDIASNGNTLLSSGMWRAALQWQAPGETTDRDMSWFDWSSLADLASDGKTVLFNETREGGGARSAIYLRRAGEPAAVRIGDGYGDAISPDGHWVLAHSGPSKLVVLPTGTGEPRELKINGNFDIGAQWFPDSKRVVVGGAVPDHGYQLWIIDTLEEKSNAITPENIWGGTIRPFAVSPDSRLVAGMTGQQTIALYDTTGTAPATPVNGAEKGEVPITFSPDAAALYVYKPIAIPAKVYRIELATGARTLWKEFSPSDPAGVYKIAPVVMTQDAGAYAYNAMRLLSDLYVAENLR